jgi:CRISPR-associated protein Csb2
VTTTLAFSFPLGRYHANPWGRHVNEGAVDLPPSPWRLLRALYATWRTRVPELSEDLVHGLLEKLAVPTHFYVPRHTIAHTRHYYPDSVHRSGSPSTDRTLDAFAVLETDAELAVEWKGTVLGRDERDALERIARVMSYLGRADSICDAVVADGWQPDERHEVWTDLQVAESVAGHAEVTTLLAPEIPLDLDALTARPVDVRRGGLLFPKGTRFVGYQCTARQVRPRAHVPQQRGVTAVRFSILQGGLPPETDSVIYTDLLRQSALSKLGYQPDGTLLGGRTNSGQPMEKHHQHAHYLPLLHERRLQGLLVWVPGELSEKELRALASVRRLYSRQNESWRLTVRLAGTGSIREVVPDLLGASREWASVTPFVPSRYPKRSADWTEFLRKEIEREVRFRGLVDAMVEQVHVDDGNWAAFRRYRPSARNRPDTAQGKPSSRGAAFVRVRFDRPVTGPLALGHLSHFGIGMFKPM